MAKNLIPIIAKELGVELNEPFKIVGNGDSLWRFTETDLQFYDKHFQDDWVNVNSQSVATFVLETPEIIKLPFEPKVGEIFWTYWTNWSVTDFEWEDKKANFDFRKFCGCVFRTKEEALAARPVKFKEITGKDWEE
ncbi:MAG: hypothetical protein IKW14_03750 [Phascolarctobacterium sp.]|nr:hypothetical protein [Phascolarctobacterium sp.]